jgi:hypothetical protein
MKDKKSLKEIKEFIEKTAEDKFENIFKNTEIQETKKLLEKKSASPEKDFTFTIGEVNAYLG